MSSSFVYPVKSLLTAVKPAAGKSCVFLALISSSIAITDDQSEVKQSRSRRIKSSSSLIPTSRRHKHRISTSKSVPNFKHYPSDDNPLPPASFSTDIPNISPHSGSPTFAFIDPFSVGAPLCAVEPTLNSDSDPRNNPPPSPVASLLPQEHMSSLPWNPAELGIVHFPLLDGGSPTGSTRGSTSSIDPSSSSPDCGQSAPSQMMSTASPHSQSNNSSDNSTASSLDSERATVRFQHVEDENGNYVVMGREGKLTKCEDEVGCVCLFSLVIGTDEGF